MAVRLTIFAALAGCELIAAVDHERIDELGCPSGFMLCDGRQCWDVSTSLEHCGACGRGCLPGQVCTSGSCSCPPGTQDCGAGCMDVTFDRNNCGSCGNVCTSAEVCLSGVCSRCAFGTECLGVCTNLALDAFNCGSCGRVCAPGQFCVNGVCSPCQIGTLCGTVCVDLMFSPLNCGECGRACYPCIQGRCPIQDGGGVSDASTDALDATSSDVDAQRVPPGRGP